MRPLISLLLILLINACSKSPDSKIITESVFTAGIEGPYALSNENILAVNFQKEGTIGCIAPNEKGSILFELPGKSVGNSIQPYGDTAIIVADYVAHKIWMYHLEDEILSVFAGNNQMNQPNDMVVHAKGWIYASDPAWADSTGKIWMIDSKGNSKLLASDMGTTNGICLNNEGTKLYVNESIQRSVWVYDVKTDGTIFNKKLFVQFDDAGLDGMKIGKHNELLIARYDAGEIGVYSADGSLIKSYKLHGKKPTNLTFNEDSTSIFVTMQDKKWIEEIVLNHN